MEIVPQLTKPFPLEYIRRNYSGPLTSEQVYQLVYKTDFGRVIHLQFDVDFPMGSEHRKEIIAIFEELAYCHGWRLVIDPDCG